MDLLSPTCQPFQLSTVLPSLLFGFSSFHGQRISNKRRSMAHSLDSVCTHFMTLLTLQHSKTTHGHSRLSIHYGAPLSLVWSLPLCSTLIVYSLKRTRYDNKSATLRSRFCISCRYYLPSKRSGIYYDISHSSP